MIRICDYCKKEILTKDSNPRRKKKHNFCNSECYLKFINENRPRLKCIKCGKMFLTSPSRVLNDVKYCSRKCCGKLKKERKLSTDGYWVIRIKNKGYFKDEIKEHRYLMQQKIGRELLQTEIVHHINFNKLDNRIENLMIVTRKEHNKIHYKTNFSK